MAYWLKRCWQLAIVLSALLLTGCLQYDLDIQFDSQTHGQLVQQLQWRGGAIATNAELQQWLELLSKRTHLVGGKTQFLTNNTFEVTVPFNNGRDLEAKFNQLFNSTNTESPFTLPSGDPIRAELSLRQGNWIVAIYNHLNLRLDLTTVPDLAETGLPLLQGQQLVEGRVKVAAPWVHLPSGDWVSRTSWALIPGEMNVIEADFWVPSPIGIGALAIGLFVAVGYGLKYGLISR